MPDEFALPEPGSLPQPRSPYRVPPPDHSRAQRARVAFHAEAGEQTVVAAAEDGWARMHDGWLDFLSDEGDGGWQSWPMRGVVLVVWL